MKKFRLSLILTTIIVLSVNAYTQTDLKGYTADNFPRMDGSTSTYPLSKIIACKLLNMEYKWMVPVNIYYPVTERDCWDVNDKESETIPFCNGRITSSQTHEAFLNLIDNKTDIILSARKMSADEKRYANSLGITLIETPIALDALIFLANEKRGVKSLTAKQLQNIYLGKIKNWAIVGGTNDTLYPYIRNANSGSQELFETIAMKGLPSSWQNHLVMEHVAHSMPEVFIAICCENPQAICFSVYYYKEMMIRNSYGNSVKTLAINGIEPNAQTIADKTYPYTAEVYAVIRSDLPEKSLAYKLYKWLQSIEGQKVVWENGYVPIAQHDKELQQYMDIYKNNPKNIVKQIPSGYWEADLTGLINLDELINQSNYFFIILNPNSGKFDIATAVHFNNWMIIDSNGMGFHGSNSLENFLEDMPDLQEGEYWIVAYLNKQLFGRKLIIKK
jgi:phosphate transport system substrate-binding protein